MLLLLKDDCYILRRMISTLDDNFVKAWRRWYPKVADVPLIKEYAEYVLAQKTFRNYNSNHESRKWIADNGDESQILSNTRISRC